MFEPNGNYPLHKPTLRRVRWSNNARDALTRLFDSPLPASLAFALLLLYFVMSATGCAAISTPSSEPAKNPTMPQPSQSQPSEPYSASALENIRRWRKSLTDTLTMP